MRTVILNTLGSELRQTSLFYLPFREEQFQWVDVDIPHIGDAAALISANSSNQGQVQDYHLVVLASLSHYRYSRYQKMRELYQDLLFVHIKHQLVLPLAQQQSLPPAAVSVVYVTPHYSDGDGDVPEQERLDALLGFAGAEEIDTLVLTTDEGERLDMTAYFRAALEDYAVSRENERSYGGNNTENYARDRLRGALAKRLKSLCVCEYAAPGEERMRFIDKESVEFCPKTSNWELFSVDLQINLSDHLAGAAAGADWHLQLCSHEEKEIQERISLALHRVRRLRDEAGRVTYYPMEPLTDTLEADMLPQRIWAALRERTDLPGVKDLTDIMHEGYNPDAVAADTEKRKTIHKLPPVWLWLGLAKKRFEAQCQALSDQYNPDTAKEQQMVVLDTCAAFFKDWRVRMLNRRRELPSEPTLQEMPHYDARAAQERLAQAQRAYGEVCVEKLEDYEDVRTEAEEIKAQFRADTRLWPKDTASSTWWFLLYSFLLAALFLLQMIWPFVGMTVEMDRSALSGYIHLGISLVVFVGLYVLGVVIWLRGLCARVSKHTQGLYTLIQHSRLRRRRSIMDAVETYGNRLPDCMIEYENLKRLERIHAANLLRKNHYHTHVQILDKAEEILLEMHTLLRLPRNVDVADNNQLRGQINYECAPSDPVNVPYYIFLSEKWGG